MPARNFTDNEEVEIGKIYLSGKSTKAIARAYGLSHHISITSALKRQGIIQRDKSERNRLYKCNPHIFDSLDNEVSAYLHGFIYADGCIMYEKTLTINISARDRSHLEKIKIAIESESPIKDIKNYGYGNGLVQLSFTERYLVGRLIKTGISTGRPNPYIAMQAIPDSTFHHWLRGFFDGDGSAKKSPDINFCGDKILLELLRARIAQNCEVNPKLAIVKHITKPLYYLSYSGRLMALKVADFMYRDATIWLERKRQVIENWPLPQIRYRNEKGQYT